MAGLQVQTWLGVRMHYGHPDFVEACQQKSAQKISELQSFSLAWLKESYGECHFPDTQAVESSLTRSLLFGLGLGMFAVNSVRCVASIHEGR